MKFNDNINTALFVNGVYRHYKKKLKYNKEIQIYLIAYRKQHDL